MTDDFFEEMTEQSEVKIEIVRKYFYSWAKVISSQMKNRSNRMAYVDLFAGPGRYQDGRKSTPLLVLESVLREADLRAKLVTVFNDANPDNAQSLQEVINSIPAIDTLAHEPKVWNKKIGVETVEAFEKATELPPMLLFVDPWGYKGLSIRLVRAVLKHWGCDCIFFFNYRRINMSLSNPVFDSHMDDLFGDVHAQKLRPMLQDLSPEEREVAILNELTLALTNAGGKFVLPFCFKNDSGSRTMHHLIFVSKNVLGYKMMKEIMGNESSIADQGVPSFSYCPADKRYPVLFEYTRPLDDLTSMLLDDFAGQSLTAKEIYESHHIGKPYVEKNYKEALRQLESTGLIMTHPPAEERRMQNGKRTFPLTVGVSFPEKE